MAPSRRQSRPSSSPRKAPRSTHGSQGPSAKPAKQTEQEEAEDLIGKAASMDEQERERLEGEAPDPPEVDPPIDMERLRTAIAQAEHASNLAQRSETNYVNAKVGLDQRRDELERHIADEQARIDETRAALDRMQAELDERRDALDAQASELGNRLKAAQELERRLFAREQDEKSAYAEYRHRQVQELEAELDRRRSEAQDRQDQRDAEAARHRSDLEKALTDRAAELNTLKLDLENQERELQLERRRLTAWEEALEQVAADARKEAEQKLGTELDTIRQEALSWQQRHDTMRELAQQRGRELADLEAARVAAGHRPYPEVVAERDQLRIEYEKLRREAASQVHAGPERLAELESRVQDLTVEREDLLRQNEELRRTVAATQISVVERENARAVNRAMQELNGVLQREIDDQTAKLKVLQASATREPPFPACSDMDTDELHQTVPELRSGMPRLHTFIERVRDLIASGYELYYSDRDLRCFLAGLAASRLHLLQGISGTGKTRLPNVFAEVIGARCDTIAVAAEWRSPQDLLGYYNAFERKFYESEFTKAVYRAQVPLYARKPYFILLDEMNLSHPEQYFSSVLSALGNDDPRLHRLPLMTSRVEAHPDLLIDGQYLSIPPNVWFFGTANHDETTVQFADKTYDRAHVLELPVEPKEFTPKEPQPLDPISLEALDREFARAADDFGDEADAVLEYFDRQLGPTLRSRLKVSWGNRLPEQTRAFVPVVRAAGGTTGEAADHLLSTKVLRKLKGRVELPKSELEALLMQVDDRWPWKDDSLPEHSVTSLEDTLRDKDIM